VVVIVAAGGVIVGVRRSAQSSIKACVSV